MGHRRYRRKRLEESFAAVSEGEFEWHTPTWTERLSGVAGSFLGRKGGRATVMQDVRAHMVQAVMLDRRFFSFLAAVP